MNDLGDAQNPGSVRVQFVGYVGGEEPYRQEREIRLLLPKVPRPGDAILFEEEDGSETTAYVRHVHTRVPRCGTPEVILVVGRSPAQA